MFEYHGPPSRIEMYRKNMDRQGVGVYFVGESQFLRSFFAMTFSYLPRGSRLLEVGYGPGTLSIYLSRCGYKVVGVDWDLDIVEHARETNRRLDGQVDFQVCEMSEIDTAFGSDSFDAVISDVTLEHFSDEDIIQALRKQLIVSKINIFAVHCANIPLTLFHGDGGERLLKPSHWDNLIRKAGGRVVNRFGYGFSHTRMGQLNWRIASIAENILYRRLARLAACTGFVVNRT
jgi:SAM-dependent methyltransferase